MAAVKTAYPNAESVAVYGGEEADPPQYGKVFVAVKPTNGLILTDTEKDSVLSALQSKNLVSITPEVVDAEYLYLRVNSKVVYNKDATTLSADGIKTLVISKIINHGDSTLEKFNEDYIQSRLAREIDSTENSIVGNELYITMEKRITPTLGALSGQTVKFRNAIFHPHDGHISVLSSNTFEHKNKSGDIVNCYFADDGRGSINLFTTINGQESLIESGIGTVNYTTGLVSLNSKFVPLDYVDKEYISITATPANQDVLARESTIITIDSFDDSVTCTVTTNSDRRSGATSSSSGSSSTSGGTSTSGGSSTY